LPGEGPGPRLKGRGSVCGVGEKPRRRLRGARAGWARGRKGREKGTGEGTRAFCLIARPLNTDAKSLAFASNPHVFVKYEYKNMNVM